MAAIACSTTSLEYGCPTLVLSCARIRSLLTVPGPVYSTSIERTMGGACGCAGACGACARATVAPSSAQTEAAQIANGGGRIHLGKYFIVKKRGPAQASPRRTGAYIGKKGSIVKARFRQAIWPQAASSFNSKVHTSYFAGAVRSLRLE